MHALILAAGRGERLRPLTDTTPKPLLRVGKRRLIEYHLHALAVAGFTEIVINHAHLGERVVSILGDGSMYGVHIHYSQEPEGALETAGGIVNALPQLKSDPFVVVNGDIWTDYPFVRLATHISGLGHIVLVDNPAEHSGGDFLLTGNHVSEINDESAGERLTFSGIGVYHHSLFQDLEPAPFPLAPVLRDAMRNNLITGEYYPGRWVDVGTPQRLAELRTELSTRNGL